jgi:autotransporter-associated beta strand protein
MLAVNYGGNTDYTQAQVAALLGKTAFGVPSTAFGFDTTNASAPVTYSNALSIAAGITKLGPGTLVLSGANTYSGDTAVISGTLKFNVASGAPTIASGVMATVASGATLELAGSISALGMAVGHRAHIVNNSVSAAGQPAGLVISGTNQIVGGIDGTGSMQVNAGSDLTADHIVQTALEIGGAAVNPALVTIAASDADGNPLDAARGGPLGLTSAQSKGGVLADLIGSDRQYLVGIDPVHFHDDLVSSEMGLIAPSLSKSNLAGAGAAVPEPSTIVLLISAIAIFGLGGRCRRK